MKIFCCKCHRLVGEIQPGSRIKRGTVYMCAECHNPQIPKTDCEVVDFLKNIIETKKNA